MESPTAEHPEEPGQRSEGAVRPAAAPVRPAAGAPFRLYKPGQGIHVRWGSAVGMGLIAVAGANFVYEQMSRLVLTEGMWLRTLVPVGLLVAAAYLIFRYLGQNRTVVDFMIATEAEMKKVNWSTRKEVFGATRVVIVTVLALALMMFVVDLFFIFFFSSIGVLRIDLLRGLFGGGTET